MGKYRGLNITGGLSANFRKIKVRKTVDTESLQDRGTIAEAASDLPTKGAGHRRGRGALKSQRKAATGATRGSISMGWIVGDDSNVIGTHDYGYIFQNTLANDQAAWETRRALGVAESIAEGSSSTAAAPVYATGVSLYNSTAIIPAGTPLILNTDGTVSAVTGTIGSTSGFIGYSRYATIPSGYQGGSVSKERMASDSQGNTYIGGYKVQPHPNNPYQQVFFFEKYDSSGNLVWSKEEAGTAIPNATWYQQGEVKAIVCDNNDDVIWSGYDKAGGNPMLVKMDPNGNIVWTKIYDKGSNSGININALTVDDNNNICGAGVSYMNGGEGYAFKFDTNGNPLWSTEIQRIASGSTAAPQDGRNIHCDSSGNLIILGSTNGGNWHNFVLLKINGSTGALDTYVELGDTNSTARAYSLILDSNDNMYVCGATDHRAYYDPANPSGQHDEDIIVFKFNSSFQLEWQKVIGTPDSTVSQGGRGIEIDSEGNIIAIGYGLGGAIVAKIQQDGTLMRLYNFKSAMSYSDNNNLYHGGGGPSIMMTKTPDDKFYWVSEVGHGDNGVYTNYDALYGFKIADSVLGTYNEENPTRSWVWADVTSTGDLIYQDHTLQTSGSWTTTLTYGDHTSLDTWNTHSISLTDVTDLEFKQVGFEGVSTTNLTDSNFIGFAKDGFTSAGQLGKVVSGGGVVAGFTGLIAGNDYYVQPDGSISEVSTAPAVLAGTALSGTTLQVAAMSPSYSYTSANAVVGNTSNNVSNNYSYSAAISLDGNTVAIGYANENTVNEQNGKVVIYNKQNGAWSETQTINCPTNTSNWNLYTASFGKTVKFTDDGTRMLVDAPSYGTWENNYGGFFIFDKNETTGLFEETQRIFNQQDFYISSERGSGMHDNRIDITSDGSLIAVQQMGVTGHYNSESKKSYILIYRKTEDGTYSYVNNHLVTDQSYYNGTHARNIALSDNGHIVLGHDDSGTANVATHGGAEHVYYDIENNTFVSQILYPTLDVPHSGYNGLRDYGEDVALTQDGEIIGVYDSGFAHQAVEDGSQQSTAIFVFKHNGDNTYSQVQRIEHPNGLGEQTQSLHFNRDGSQLYAASSSKLTVFNWDNETNTYVEDSTTDGYSTYRNRFWMSRDGAHMLMVNGATFNTYGGTT